MPITITHLEGSPLAVKKPDTFEDDVKEITFGRSHENDVIFPPDCDTVGGADMVLARTGPGTYEVRRRGQHYLEIDRQPTPKDLNNIPIASGTVIRLGGRNGPSFRVVAEKPKKMGPFHTAATRTVEVVKSVADQLSNTLRILVIGFGVVALAVASLATYSVVRDQKIAGQVGAVEDRQKEISRLQFGERVIKPLKNAVYLVAQDPGGEPVGTAWAIDDASLATNAHVVTEVEKALQQKRRVFVLGNGIEREIISAYAHPGHKEFEEYAKDHGNDLRTMFERLDLASVYDVGILRLAPGNPLPSKLDIAPKAELLTLTSGMPVALAGFPFEDLTGVGPASRDPEPQVRYGNISSMTDVFMSRSEDPDQRLFVQHTLPNTGGASGSPIINTDGKVIAIFSGGNVIVLPDGYRMPNAAQVNFAQRADVLRNLMEGVNAAETAVQRDRDYWEKRRKALKLESYLEYELNVFRRDMRDRFKVSGNGEIIEAGAGKAIGADGVSTLQSWTFGVAPRSVTESYSFDAEPGYLYGFIAQSVGGRDPRIGIEIRAGDNKLGERSEPGNVAGRFLDPAAWVTVTEPTKLTVVLWGKIYHEARYSLHGLKWKLPDTSAATGVP